MLCKSDVEGMNLSSETCSLYLFDISMEALKPCYLHGVANFLSKGDSFKLVGFLLFTPLEVCIEILKA